MMKTMKIVTVLLAVILLTSCEKFLEEEPRTQFTSGNFFVDKVTLDAGVVGMYSSAKDLFGIYSNTPFFMTLLGTDEAMFRGTAGIRYDFDRYTFSPGNEAIYEFWIRHYQIAARANDVIAAAASVTSLTEAERNVITGEARFMRAFVYFRLVQAFGGLPITTEPNTGDFDFGLPRSSIWEVYQLIIDDLQFASASGILPLEKTGNGHVHHWAAKALLGKVYLTMASAKETAMTKQSGKVDGYKTIDTSVPELYAKAWEVLRDVIDNSGADLLPRYGDVFEIANKNVNKESIWELQFSPIEPYGSSWSKEFGMAASGSIDGNPVYYTNAMAGVRNLVYVPKFYWYYKDGLDAPNYDKRRLWNLTDSLIQAVGNKPAKLLYIWGTAYSPDSYNSTILARCGATKYRWGKSWMDTSPYLYSNAPNNVIVLRFADVLLMFAEADYKKNGTISAEGLVAINRVRQRARGLDDQGLPIPEAATPGFKDYTAADIDINEILEERARELCFEFQRWFDLARTGKFEYFLEKTRSPSDTELYNTATEFDPEKHYLFPIPQAEIDLSTNKEHFKQNPNY